MVLFKVVMRWVSYYRLKWTKQNEVENGGREENNYSPS